MKEYRLSILRRFAGWCSDPLSNVCDGAPPILSEKYKWFKIYFGTGTLSSRNEKHVKWKYAGCPFYLLEKRLIKCI
jgi:hypothetical protein